MRHLWSSLAGLLAAPVVWALLALGQVGSAQTIAEWEERGAYNTADLIAPAAYLTAAGVVLGLLATLRVSPAGPLVAGVLLAGPYVAMFANPFRVRDAVPADGELLDQPLSWRLPLDNGTLLLVGVLLLIAVFSVQRWRQWPAPAAAPAAQAEPAEATVAGAPGGAPEPVPTDADGEWRRPAAAEVGTATEAKEAGEPGTAEPVPAPRAADEPRPDQPEPDRTAERAGPDRTAERAGPYRTAEPAGPDRAAEPAATEQPAAAAWPPPATPASQQPSAPPPPTESPWLAPPRQANRKDTGE